MNVALPQTTWLFFFFFYTSLLPDRTELMKTHPIYILLSSTPGTEIYYTTDGELAHKWKHTYSALPLISFMPSSLVTNVCSSCACSEACWLVCVRAVRGVSAVLPLLPGLSSTGYSSLYSDANSQSQGHSVTRSALLGIFIVVSCS